MFYRDFFYKSINLLYNLYEGFIWFGIYDSLGQNGITPCYKIKHFFVLYATYSFF